MKRDYNERIVLIREILSLLNNIIQGINYLKNKQIFIEFQCTQLKNTNCLMNTSEDTQSNTSPIGIATPLNLCITQAPLEVKVTLNLTFFKYPPQKKKNSKQHKY